MATFSEQASLPSLPLPTLDETLDRYLENALVLLDTEEERAKTTAAVAETRRSPHIRLIQEALENRARGSRNWLEDWWYDAYLEIRTPLIPYLSLASINPASPKSGDREMQLLRAADAVYHYMRVWEGLRKEKMPVTKSRGRFWDMNQFHVLFNSNRTPALPKDRMDRYFKTESEGSCPSHVAVLCRGAVWRLEMLVGDGHLRSPDDIHRQLRHMQHVSPNVSHSPATLTSEHRDTWAQLRAELLSLSPANARSLAIVEQAAFVLSLSDDVIGDEEELLAYAMCGRSDVQWADKCVNIVVMADAQILTQGDHSNLDAMAILDAGNQMGAAMRKEKWKPKETNSSDLPERLHFDLSNNLLNAINVAEAHFQQQKTTFRARVVRFGGYGNERCRPLKIYSDTVVQLALQLAYAKVHGSCAPIYETASTRAFFHGRTETVRGCTAASRDFIHSVLKEKRPLTEQLAAFKLAYAAHNRLMADATEGKGVDRHLYGLRKTHAELNRAKCCPPLPLPAIFADPAWQKAGGDGNFLLSSSFIGYNAAGAYGYVCAMRPDGYGTFYKIHGDSILLTVTDYTGTKSDLPAYGRAVEWALGHLGGLLTEIERSAASKM